MNFFYPLQFTSRGGTQLAADDDHISQMIEQLLFTNPGERVNRPDFGSGLQQLIFAPNSPELAAAVQFNMQGALQRYLGDLIEVRALNVISQDAALYVEVRYVVRSTSQPQTAKFMQPTG